MVLDLPGVELLLEGLHRHGFLRAPDQLVCHCLQELAKDAGVGGHVIHSDLEVGHPVDDRLDPSLVGQVCQQCLYRHNNAINYIKLTVIATLPAFLKHML